MKVYRIILILKYKNKQNNAYFKSNKYFILIHLYLKLLQKNNLNNIDVRYHL